MNISCNIIWYLGNCILSDMIKICDVFLDKKLSAITPCINLILHVKLVLNSNNLDADCHPLLLCYDSIIEMKTGEIVPRCDLRLPVISFTC